MGTTARKPKQQGQAGRRKDVDKYFTCATLRHAWEPCAIPPGWGHLAEFVLFLDCVRCGSHRQDDISRTTGEVEHRNYYYSDGYRRYLDEEDRDGHQRRSDLAISQEDLFRREAS